MLTPSTQSAYVSTADLRACGACGQVYRSGQLRDGRGRHLGEHPEHRFAPCGHAQTWYGSHAVRACAHCGDPLPVGSPTAVVECSPCFEWLNSTCGEDGPVIVAL